MNDRYFVGQIVWFAFNYPPAGFLPCNGRVALNRSQNAALFHAIGYSYGGSGEQFRLPDMSAESLTPDGHGGFHMCVRGVFPQLR